MIFASPKYLSGLFETKAVWIMQQLLRDFPQLTNIDAAAIVGNLGHETGGFAHMQELAPASGRGGYGWAQWTGPRRVAFENWAASKGLHISSDAANYGFLVHELKGSEAGAITALRNASGIDNKTKAFENKYERAGVKAYNSRINFAKKALAAYTNQPYTQYQVNDDENDAEDDAEAKRATLISTAGMDTLPGILIFGALLFMGYQIFFSKS